MRVEVHAGSKTSFSDFIEVLKTIESSKQMVFVDAHVVFEEEAA